MSTPRRTNGRQAEADRPTTRRVECVSTAGDMRHMGDVTAQVGGGPQADTPGAFQALGRRLESCRGRQPLPARISLLAHRRCRARCAAGMPAPGSGVTQVCRRSWSGRPDPAARGSGQVSVEVPRPDSRVVRTRRQPGWTAPRCPGSRRSGPDGCRAVHRSGRCTSGRRGRGRGSLGGGPPSGCSLIEFRSLAPGTEAAGHRCDDPAPLLLWTLPPGYVSNPTWTGAAHEMPAGAYWRQ